MVFVFLLKIVKYIEIASSCQRESETFLQISWICNKISYKERSIITVKPQSHRLWGLTYTVNLSLN